MTRFVEDLSGSGGDPLHVDVEDAADTGTMHYAEKVTLRSRGRELVFRSDVGRGVLVPLLRRRVRLDATRELLVGWSSTHGGHQATHAWLVAHGDAGLDVGDRLEVSQVRGRSALLFRRRGDKLEIGVPAPHDPDRLLDEPWLRTHTLEVPITEWNRLVFASPTTTPHVELFCPPFGRALAPRGLTWLRVAQDRFVAR